MYVFYNCLSVQIRLDSVFVLNSYICFSDLLSRLIGMPEYMEIVGPF